MRSKKEIIAALIVAGRPDLANHFAYARTAEASELLTYTQNDGQIYRQRVVPIQKNLERKWRNGSYNPAKAPQIWMYALEDGAKKYVKELINLERDIGPGSKWSDIFPKSVRMEAARDWAREWEEEAKVQFGPEG